ncbi:MAG: putative bifunctional diguanylate cyclase/phosphodiesterase [Halanaerobiaceae bacterium]
MVKMKLQHLYEEYFREEVNTYRHSGIQWIKIAICVIIYFFTSYILAGGAMRYGGIVFGNISFQPEVFLGVVSQIRVLVSVYLVVSVGNKGYLVAMILNIYGTVSASASVLAGSMSAANGIVAGLGTLVILTIIFRYKRKLKGQIQVVTDQKEQLKHMAYYDSLTEIPNRKLVIERLKELIPFADKQRTKFAFVFIDLDDFKKINDTLGHQAGDKVLQMVVEKWKPYIHSQDLFGRLGGDEFALIIPRNLAREEILQYLLQLSEELAGEPFECSGRNFYLTGSFGVAIYPEDGENAATLMKSADIAMYSAKDQENDVIKFFTREMEEKLLYKIKLENGLQMAVWDKELFMVYQPQYFCQPQNIRGFEALVRWESPEMGHIKPSEFIPVAEESGVINELGEWILKNVLIQFQIIMEKYNIEPVLSVNVSVEQLTATSFIPMIERVLRETGFDPKKLEFEVTESVLITYPEYVVEVLRYISDLGISIALDDFGTGYASMSYLQNIPLDTLKIDRVFIKNIGTDASKKDVISPMIAIAHQLDILVIAEGVETEKQLKFLKKEGCDCVQGFYLSYPLTGTQIKKVMRTV